MKPDGRISTSFLIRADQIETLLAIGRRVNPDHFWSLNYQIQRMLYGAGVPVPVGVDPASDGSYFKFNLDSINLYNLNRLEASSAKAIHQSACSMLGAHTAPHQNAFFKVIDLPLSGPWAERDSQTFALLDGWLLISRRDFTVDLHGVVPVCGDQASDPVPEIAARSQASRRGKRRQPADRPSIRAPAGATC